MREKEEEKEMAASTGVGGNREGSAKATVAEQISQAVQSTSNLLHLMQESSPAQIMQVVIIDEDTIDSSSRAHGALLENQKARLIRLPKNLLAKASVTKNTGQILEHLPHVISSLDAYMESSLQSASHLKTVSQLLSNMESSQLKPSFPLHQHRDEQKDPDSEEIVKVS